MDIEKLIEQLKNLEACAYGYHINGEVLGMNCSDFEQVMVDAADEIANVPTLRAENKRLKSLLGESGQDLWSKENQRADRLEAENNKLRAELERVKQCIEMVEKQRDAAVTDLTSVGKGECWVCTHFRDGGRKCHDCEDGSNWEWRGLEAEAALRREQE